MAARINKPFLFGLIAVVVLLAVGLSVAYVVVTTEDPDKIVARADALMAEGNIERAVEQYGKALKLKKNNVPLILKYLEGIDKLEAISPDQARKYLTQKITWNNTALQADPGNREAFGNLMDLYYTVGTRLNDAGVWDRMYEITATTLTRDPERPDVRKWRGVAQTYRMRQVNLGRDDREQAREDLTQAITEDPDDLTSAYTLALWHLQEADRKRTAQATPAEVATHRDEALALAHAVAESEPDDPWHQLNLFRVLLRTGQSEQAREVVSRLEQLLIKDPNPPYAVRAVSDLLPIVLRDEDDRGQSPEGLERGLALLELGVQTHPNNVLLLSKLGEKQLLTGALEDAQATFEKAGSIEPRGELLELIQAGEAQVGARLQLADLKIRLAERATGPEREAYQRDAEEIVRQIRQQRGETGPLNLLLGKLELQRGNLNEAGTRFAQANTQFQDRNPEALRLAASVRQQQGQNGTAAERLEQLLRLRPGFTRARQQLAAIYIQLRQFDDAQRHIERAQEQEPDTMRTSLLRAALHAARDETADAIRLYRGLQPSKNPEALMPLVRLLVAQERNAEARLAIEQRLDEAPDDLRALALLASLLEDGQDALAPRLAAAEAAGASEQGLSLLRSQISGGTDMRQQVEELLGQEEDPIKRDLTLYRYYRQINDTQKAEAAFARAKQTDPDHPAVVEMEFTQALANQDWEQARALAARAEALNLDNAGGAMFQGQLAMARNDPSRAASYFRRGLDINPVFSDRWRLLGDALRATGDLGGARNAYERALEQQPNNVQAMRGLIAVESGFENHNTALSLFERAMEFAPRDLRLRHAYLLYQAQHGDRGVALRERRELVQDEPRFIENRRTLAIMLAGDGSIDAALRQIDAIDEITGPSRANVQTRLQVLLAADEPERALAVISAYLEQRGDEVTAQDYLMQANLMRTLGDSSAEFAAYQKAVAAEDPAQREGTRALSDRLFEAGRYQEAIDGYERLHRIDPNDIRVMRRLTEAYLRSEQIENAKAMLDKALAVSQTSQEYMLQALVAQAQEDKDAALAAINRGIEADPNNAMVHYQRAVLTYDDTTQDQSTQSDLNRAIELDPRLPQARRLLAKLYIRQGQIREATRELRSLLSRVPQSRAGRQDLLELYLARRQFSEAASLIRDGIQAFPDDPIWPRAMAQLLERTGQARDAIDYRRQALALETSPQAVGELAQTYLALNRPTDALSVLRDQITMTNQVPLLQVLRARSLAALDRQAEAGQLFRRVIERAQSIEVMNMAVRQMAATVQPAQVLAMLDGVTLDQQRSDMLNLLRAQLEVLLQDYSAATARLEGLAPPEPEDSPQRALYDRLLGLALFQQGRFSESRRVYEHLLEISPDDISVLNNLAYLLADQLDEPGQAVELARRAVELEPGNAQVLDTLGWCLYKNGSIDEARRVLERSIEVVALAPNTYHLAVIMTEQQELLRAEQLLEQSLELSRQSGEQQYATLAREQLDVIRNRTGQDSP